MVLWLDEGTSFRRREPRGCGLSNGRLPRMSWNSSPPRGGGGARRLRGPGLRRGSIEPDGSVTGRSARRRDRRWIGRHDWVDQYHQHTVVTREVVVSLIFFSVTRAALGVSAELEVLAAHAGQIEDGLALLDVLDRRWGTEDELAGLAALPVGWSTGVDWDTALLLSMFPAQGLMVDINLAAVTRTGPVILPSWQERQTLAAELVLRELMDGGCTAAAVAMGGVCLVEHGGMAVPFRHRRTARPAFS